jgi:hypothetical protein
VQVEARDTPLFEAHVALPYPAPATPRARVARRFVRRLHGYGSLPPPSTS